MRDFRTLTKRGKAQRARKALLQALGAYALEVRSLRFVSHNNSMPVYRVHTDDGHYVAKFHDASEHTLAQMLGEVHFLDHISRCSRLSVPAPLPNSCGELATRVTSHWLPETAHVFLSTWLPGRQLRDSMSTHSYQCLGTCSAMLHELSPSFRPGPGFSILTNSQVFYWDKETILSLDERRLLARERQSLFRKAARAAQQAISRLWDTGEPMVIHNDLHPCNVKVHRGGLSVYDFEDITWGFPEQDIGTAMYHVRFRDDYLELLAAFREGYEDVLPWPFRSRHELDRFVIARLLMFANYVVNFNINPIKHLAQFEMKLQTLLNGRGS